jgi:outer membrane protein OmpA-like peptidoglycan-associated protein
MAYLHISDDSFRLGSPGCGPNCPCAPCRSAAARLGQWYVRDEEATSESKARPTEGSAVQERGKEPRLGRTMGGAPSSRHVTMPPTVIHIRPFRVLPHFEFDHSALRPFHRPLIHITAQHVVASWNTPQPIRMIRLVGHTDPIGPEPYNVDLGQRRAMEAQTALINAIERLRPGLSRQISIVPQSLGESRQAARDRTPEARARNRRVEIFLSTMAAAPVQQVPMRSPVQPSPPAPSRPIRIPTPEEAARAVVPLGPETPEERIRRILTTAPPTPPPRRSFSEMFWRRVDESLNSTMSRVGVPPSLRGPIRDATHAAIQRGAESLLSRALDETDLSSEAKEAIRAAVRAAAQTPIR